MRRLRSSFLFEQLHIGSADQEGSYRDVALVDRYGISFDVIGADVGDLCADLEVVISLTLCEGVGEVGCALIGEVYALYLIGDVYVIDGVLIEQAVIRDEFIHLGEILRGELLAVWEGRECDAASTESACLKNCRYSARVDEINANVYTSVDAGQNEIVLSFKSCDAESYTVRRG